MIEKRDFYINGKWVKPFKPNDFEVINPSNEKTFAVISLGSKADVDLAVKVSKDAFGSWKETAKEEREAAVADRVFPRAAAGGQ